jgi:hypothetical protein
MLLNLPNENKSEMCAAEIMGVSRSQVNRIRKSRKKIEIRKKCSNQQLKYWPIDLSMLILTILFTIGFVK